MPKTLLLADDSVTIQKVVGISFASEDVTLITVDNGNDAIARARESLPDVVLADVVMPGKNGYEVCEALQADPQLRHVPVLLLTGTFESFDEERAKRCGAAGHVAKPFEAQALVERVKQLFQQAAAAPPPSPTPSPQPPPMPAAPVETPAAPASDSFDFFDEDLGDLAAPEPAAAAGGPGAGGLDLGSSEAFAFGEDSLAVDVTEPPPAPTPTPQEVLQHPSDRTVAILPEEESGPAAALSEQLGQDSEPHLDAPAPASHADDPLAREPAAPPPPAAAAADEDPFDFDLGGPAESHAPLGAEDLAQATLLDPKGASGYDVSSSDLGDPFDAGLDPAHEPVPELDLGDSAGSSEPFAALDPAGDSLTSWAEPEPEPMLAQVTAEETQEGMALPAVEVDENALEDLAPAVPAPPALEDSGLPTHDPAAVAGTALADITPRLKEELHDTLEKIAWESFGAVTEQVVRQAVERVEQIAWEVIPQLAEALIREEIRRMKGESR